MAGLSSFNQFSCKTASVSLPMSKISSKPALLPANLVGFASRKAVAPAEWSKVSIRTCPILNVRAVSEDIGVAVVEEPPPKEPTEIDLLKKQLVDSFYGTDRGLRATSETRAEVVELITQLETKNPTPAPTEALTLLNGKWILAYTSFLGLFPLLSRTPSLVKVEEISQTIESENFTVQDSILFSGPLVTTSIIANAKFEVRSPKRVQIKFVEGIIGTPQLTNSIVMPENVEVLGQNIDLTPFKGLINSVQDTAASIANTISSQPPLKFSASNADVESWILTTYLDGELRISRGDGGSIFVFIKEGSSFLTL